MRATAIVITAPTERWAAQAATTMTGFATSVIACGCRSKRQESIRCRLNRRRDGRPGVRVLLFAVSSAGTAKATAKPRRAMRAYEPGFGSCYAGIGLRWKTSSSSGMQFVSSAMLAGRLPSGSAPADTGACR